MLDEFGRAHYMDKAHSLIAKSTLDLSIMEDVLVGMQRLSELCPPNMAGADNTERLDGRTALHQASLALINVRGSLIADGKIKAANIANDIRGKIISWFDHNEE